MVKHVIRFGRAMGNQHATGGKWQNKEYESGNRAM
jgi:hypothetical protein